MVAFNNNSGLIYVNGVQMPSTNQRASQQSFMNMQINSAVRPSWGHLTDRPMWVVIVVVDFVNGRDHFCAEVC